MARPASTQPTEGELEILRVLWEGGPSELKQVLRRAETQPGGGDDHSGHDASSNAREGAGGSPRG